MATFANLSTVPIIGLSGMALYQAQAQRIYDGAQVIFYNSNLNGGAYFAMNTRDWWNFEQTNQDGFNVTQSNAQVLTVTYLPAPNPQYTFQILDSSGLPINYRINGSAGEASSQWLNDSQSNAPTNGYSTIVDTYFSFNINSTTGQIISILSYVSSSSTPTISPNYPLIYNTQYTTIQAMDGGQPSQYIGFQIVTPSPYMQKLATINTLQCCSAASTPGFSDQTSLDICSDQGLEGYNSNDCQMLVNSKCSSVLGVTSNANESLCTQIIIASPGQYDGIMNTYCASTTGKADPTCSCINPSAPQVDTSFSTNASSTALSNLNSALAQMEARPDCFDTTCVTNGYLTESLVNVHSVACPSINSVNCINYSQLSLSGGSSVAGSVSLSQSPECQSSSSTTTNVSTSPASPTASSTSSATSSTTATSPTNASTASPTNSSSSSTPTTSTSSTSPSLLFWIILIAAIILVIGLIVYFVTKSKKKKTLSGSPAPSTVQPTAQSNFTVH